MIDYDLLIGVAFILVLAMIVGGVVLLYPLSRKATELLDLRIRERAAEIPGGLKADRLDARLTEIEARLGEIQDRQRFLDELLIEKRPARELPPPGE
jgi:hypothetical protein